MSPRPLRTPGIVLTSESLEEGPERHDVGMVAHVDGRPVVIGEFFAEGRRPDGTSVALPARANAQWVAACWNGCEAADLDVADVEAGIVAAAIQGAGGDR